MNLQKKNSDYGITKKTLFFCWVFMLYNYSWGITKVVLGVINGTYFYCLSGVTEIILGFCKSLFLLGHHKNEEGYQIKAYKTIAILVIVASLFYLAYMVSLFFYPEEESLLPIWGSILVSVIALGDLFLSLIGINKNIKRKDLLFTSRKCLSLVWSLQAFAFAVAAILEIIKDKDSAFMVSMYNASFGVITALMTLAIGV